MEPTPAEWIKIRRYLTEDSPLVRPYSIYLHIMCAITVCTGSVSIYFYRTRFHEAGAVRHFIIHTIIGSVVMITTFSIYQPMIIPGYFGGYSTGLLNYFGPDGSWIGLTLVCAAFTHLDFLFTLGFAQMCHRQRVFGSGFARPLFDWLEEEKNTVKVMRCSGVVHLSLSIIAQLILRPYLLDLSKPTPLVDPNSAPIPKSLTLLPLSTTPLRIMASIIAIVTITQLTICVLANIFTLRTVKETAEVVTQRTHDLQIRMYRHLSAQLIGVVIFLHIPLSIAIIHALNLLPALIDRHGQMWSVCFMALHCPVQTVISWFGFPQLRKMLFSVAAPISHVLMSSTEKAHEDGQKRRWTMP